MREPSAINGQRSPIGGQPLAASRRYKSRLTPQASSPRPSVRAFTLTEMMIAVAVLIVVIIATSRIFGTASKITSIGNATTDVLRTAAAIERQMRDDISRLTPEGFFTIHSVAVRNDVRGATAPLLDPTKPLDYLFRCDQLMFFANGVQSPMTFRQGTGINHDGQATVARVLYSHGFQVPNALPVKPVGAGNDRVDAYDPNFSPVGVGAGFLWNGAAGQISPWYPAQGQVAMFNMIGTVFQDSHTPGPGDYTTALYAPNTSNLTQPPPSQWILAREPVVLADDDANAITDTNKVVFLNVGRSLYSIFPVGAGAFGTKCAAIRKGRVDAAAENLNDVRRQITSGPATGVPVGWLTTSAGAPQRNRIMRAMYYPRAEARAPGMHRVDQALVNNALSIGCSSFRVDWTYENPAGDIVDANGNAIGGTGAALDANGNVTVDINGVPFSGVRINPATEHPWFGLRDPASSVYNYGDPLSPFVSTGNLFYATTIDANNIQATVNSTPPAPAPPAGVVDYWAVFGYNQTMPFQDLSIDPDPAGSNFDGIPSRRYFGAGSEPNSSNSAQIAYTPWPTAIRVTMVLTDPEGRLEGGREFQFVIELPKRLQ